MRSGDEYGVTVVVTDGGAHSCDEGANRGEKEEIKGENEME